MRIQLPLVGPLAALLILADSVPAQTIAIVGGRVFPVSGAPIEAGTVLIRDGKIVAVGANVSVPEGAERIDAAGKWVTPGFVNSATQLGLVEIGQVAETREGTARGRDGIAAAFTVWEGFNPASVLLAPARNDGITSAVVYPSGGLIAGQAAIVDLVQGGISDMVLRAPVAMVGQVGGAQAAGAGSRGELLVRLRELFADVRAYQRRRSDYETGDTREFAASRADLEALIPVVEGRLPLLLNADKASDIESALRIAREFKLRLMIGGGAEAWMVVEQLAKADIPVFTGAMNNIPSSFSSLGTRQDNAAILRRAGIRVAIVGNAGGSSEDAFNARNLKYEAGNAVAYGLTWEEALRAITLTPAEIFGVEGRIGSLRAGRDANIVIWSGDPFEFSTRVEAVFIRGRRITEPSRQDMLSERYKQLPPSYMRP